MANIFLEEVTYITEEELKDSTRITDPAFAGEDEPAPDNRTILIRKSEMVIDSVI